MSEKVSKRILIGELIVIVLPLSLILFFYTFLLVFSLIRNFQWSFLWNWNSSYLFDIVLDLLALLACISIISVVVISQKFLKHGKAGLDTIGKIWWILSFLGGFIAIAAIIVPLLPPSPECSAIFWFRIEFEAFKNGIPVLIPLIYLLLEKNFRKPVELSL